MSSVRFNYADVRPISLTPKNTIKQYIVELFVAEGKKLASLNYIFCTDKFLIDINNAYLGHNSFTDIITFNLSEGKEITGEVYISVERVKANALIYSVTFKEELLRVILHGALHLCGYNDKRKSEITIMRQKEDYYLRMFEKKIQ